MATPRTDGSYARIYAVVRRIPRGFVATYGQVAALAGLAGHARQVGYALHALAGDSPLPWQRVVNARGEVSPRRSRAGTAFSARCSSARASSSTRAAASTWPASAGARAREPASDPPREASLEALRPVGRRRARAAPRGARNPHRDRWARAGRPSPKSRSPPSTRTPRRAGSPAACAFAPSRPRTGRRSTPRAFAAFRGYLESSYPRLHAALAQERVGGDSLLYTWKGREPDAAGVAAARAPGRRARSRRDREPVVASALRRP